MSVSKTNQKMSESEISQNVSESEANQIMSEIGANQQVSESNSNQKMSDSATSSISLAISETNEYLSEFEKKQILETETHDMLLPSTVTNRKITESETNQRMSVCEENQKLSLKKRRRIKHSWFKRKASTKNMEPVVTLYTECCFCHEGENELCGQLFQDKEARLAAHQYCLFFSAGLPQQGLDEEGFDGFLHKDIVKEAQRANKIICKFCERPGASSGCSLKSCRVTYHYSCGFKEGLQFLFNDCFDTYCKGHRTYQDFSALSMRRLSFGANLCPLCLEEVVSDHKVTLKTPCCKNIFVHRVCVQTQASVSGYFFRCPTCNNEKEFQAEMAKYGIYIPQRDAAWEENNAFSDLLEQYHRCDNSACRCPKGKTYSTETGKWCLLRCYHCGQSAVHRHCLGNNISPDYNFVCGDCSDAVGAVKLATVISPERFDERYRQHKRLLAALHDKEDPVLLSSHVFAATLWKKKFNIVECRVVLKPLPNRVLQKVRRNKINLKWLNEDLGTKKSPLIKKRTNRKRPRPNKTQKNKRILTKRPVTTINSHLPRPQSIVDDNVIEIPIKKTPEREQQTGMSFTLKTPERVSTTNICSPKEGLSKTAERILSCISSSPLLTGRKRTFSQTTTTSTLSSPPMLLPSITSSDSDASPKKKLIVHFPFGNKRKKRDFVNEVEKIENVLGRTHRQVVVNEMKKREESLERTHRRDLTGVTNNIEKLPGRTQREGVVNKTNRSEKLPEKTQRRDVHKTAKSGTDSKRTQRQDAMHIADNREKIPGRSQHRDVLNIGDDNEKVPEKTQCWDVNIADNSRKMPGMLKRRDVVNKTKKIEKGLLRKQRRDVINVTDNCEKVPGKTKRRIVANESVGAEKKVDKEINVYDIYESLVSDDDSEETVTADEVESVSLTGSTKDNLKIRKYLAVDSKHSEETVISKLKWRHDKTDKHFKSNKRNMLSKTRNKMKKSQSLEKNHTISEWLRKSVQKMSEPVSDSNEIAGRPKLRFIERGIITPKKANPNVKGWSSSEDIPTDKHILDSEKRENLVVNPVSPLLHSLSTVLRENNVNSTTSYGQLNISPKSHPPRNTNEYMRTPTSLPGIHTLLTSTESTRSPELPFV